ncbi:MAG: FtsX-like permease family protein [Thermoguttaceae bacterium]|nr:FtsX-like permease family protein [Thermoguttaceae bacterium]MDW8037329.1 FtsX-like permease family protein [Thermoguttaceae bacterium]
MSRWRLLWRTVVFFWRSNLAVAGGVAVSAAVITGALILGDSLRGSLRRMSLDRLGPVDAVLRTDRFFREALAEELQVRLANHPQQAQTGPIRFVPLILMEGMAATSDRQPTRSVGRVQIVGCDERFWRLGGQGQQSEDNSENLSTASYQVTTVSETEPFAKKELLSAPNRQPISHSIWPSGRSISSAWRTREDEEPAVLVNQPLAEQMGLEPGQEILIRFFAWQNIAPESTLGRKGGTVRSWRVRVAGLVPEDRWPGRFALSDFQQKPLLVYVPLRALQRLIGQSERVNTILAIRQSGPLEPPVTQESVLADCLRPSAEDYGLRFERVERGKYTYIHITTDQLLFPPPLEETLRRALEGHVFQPVLTYLANAIQLSPPRHPPITEQPADGQIVPYSTISAIDFQMAEPFGPFRSVDGRPLPPLRDTPEPEIVLNAWAARSLGIRLPEELPDSKAPPEKLSAKTPIGLQPGATDSSASKDMALLKAAVSTQSDKKTGSSSDLNKKAYTHVWNQASETAAGTASVGRDPGPFGPLPKYVYVTFFEPETMEGQTVERTVRFRLAGIVRMEGPARDRHLTPEVPGLTDRRSISQWDVPFEPFYEGLIRPADEEYFRQEGLTPKAFVSLATGWRLWASRFGRVSSFRVAAGSTVTLQELRQRIQQSAEPAKLGFVFQPVKRRALAASEGTGSFEVLFLGFSGFLILSAGMLVVLLFRLGVQRRQEQLGLLLALGFSSGQIRRFLLVEGLLAVLAGSSLGTLGGLGYGAAVLGGFRAWASDNINIWFLQLEVRPESFLIGFLAAVLLAVPTIGWAVHRSAQASPRHLLSGLPLEEADAKDTSALASQRLRLLRWAIRLLIVLAAAVGLIGWTGFRSQEMVQAGAFFAAGLLMLIAGLLWTRQLLYPRGKEISEIVFTSKVALLQLALRSAGRNPRRSSLTVGLMAAAVFLITATSLFRVQMPSHVPRLDDGAGGLVLWAETTMPIFYDLGQPEGRTRLETWKQEYEQFFKNLPIQVFSVRVRSGDDASCRNLYRPGQPRVLGLSEAFLHRSAFAWAQTLAQTSEEKNNPWLLLQRPLEEQADGQWVVPAIADADSATYSLKVRLGEDVELRTDQGHTVRFRIVGLLRRSIFQGNLLIWEKHFVRLFPEVQGYRLFLTSLATDQLAPLPRLEETWQEALGEYGLRLQRCRDRQAAFLAVQNTYLATFQSLGGLGLVLGVLGLGVVQVRQVLERRRELAVLAAVGFSPARLGALLLCETWMLLALGLGCGLLAAAVAVWPHWLTGQGTMPWTMLAGGLLVVVAVGTLAGLLAVRTALRLPVLQLLRTE